MVSYNNLQGSVQPSVKTFILAFPYLTNNGNLSLWFVYDKSSIIIVHRWFLHNACVQYRKKL